MPSQRFSIRMRIRSFSYAIAGFRRFIHREHNARIHLAGTTAVIFAAFFLHVSRAEAVSLTVVTALVWITEMLNTCVEKICDLITLEEHPEIKFIKDLGAGAVLVAALAAVITGLFIFIPKIV